jgi:hypothetical protein
MKGYTDWLDGSALPTVVRLWPTLICVLHGFLLSRALNAQDLKDHMRKAGGEVLYSKIMEDEDGRSKVRQGASMVGTC